VRERGSGERAEENGSRLRVESNKSERQSGPTRRGGLGRRGEGRRTKDEEMQMMMVRVRVMSKRVRTRIKKQ
jgi:hypothetical protein